MKVKNQRIEQIGVYFGKCMRIFWNEKGWKVILFGAIISAIIAWVPGDKMFVNKQNTRNGIFAIVCACIWIGLFNSIQSICRERKIIKREHRTGLHISSYILAHMLYEFLICVIQTLIMIIAIVIFRDNIPTDGTMFPALMELYISCFLCMYSSDVLGIAVSSFVKSENAAMAAMPFVLIIQLVLAGIIFELEGSVATVANFTVSKWGVQAMCATSNINNMPDAFTNLQYDKEIEELEDAGMKPSEHDKDDIYDKYMDEQKDDDERTDKSFNHKAGNVMKSWGFLSLYTILYGVISVVSLEFVDKDKR
jgi:hypothetical protein